MKNFQIILICLLLSVTSQAQMTGGGKVNSNNPKAEEQIQKEEPANAIIRKYNSFFRVGGVTPLGMFGTAPSSGYIYESFNGESGVGAVAGYSLEWGTNSYFNLPIIEQLAVGLQYGIGASFNPIDWSDLNGWDEEDVDFIFGTEFFTGPTIAYNPIDKVIVSAAFLIIPSYYVSPTMSYSYSDNDDYTSYNIAPVSYYMTQTGFQLNVLYGGLSLGLEVIGGTGKYEYDLAYYIDSYNSNTGTWEYNSGSLTYEASLPIRTVRLMLGFAF